jgi:predicted RNA-binding Zn ribbon-like protein
MRPLDEADVEAVLRFASPSDPRDRMTDEIRAFPPPGGLASPPAARILAGEAEALRAAVHELLRATAAGEAPSDRTLLALDRALRAGPTVARVIRSGARVGLRDEVAARTPLALLAPLARAAVRLAAEVDPDRLRVCDAPTCGRWFVDTSKGGRRRWCSMTRCGNRAKAARHRRRQAADQL